MLARGWRRGPLAVARTSWLQTSCMMLSSAVPLKTIRSRYSIEKQRLVLQVLQAMHDEAGRPNPFQVKSWFRVPFDDKYPVELQGKDIDISRLRTDKREGLLDAEAEAQLDVIGFVWDVDEYRWNQTKRALETYKQLRGDLLVPQDFNVPTDDPQWPLELWTKRLGNVVSKLRTAKATLASEKKQWLDAMGFVWDVKEDHWESNLEALQTYKAIHGDLLVLRSFVVPTDDGTWPKRLRGLHLGNVVTVLRHHAATLPRHKRDVLADMGFVWRVRRVSAARESRPPSTFPKQHDFVQVVRTQRSQQLHTEFVTLPTPFVVPNEDPWPPNLRGVGFNVTAFRRAYKDGRLQPSVVENLDEMGFVWNYEKHQWNLNMEALEIYKTLHRDLLVRSDFSIPHDDPRWPVYLGGKNLGCVVANLRQAREKLTSAEQDQLDSMGFVWDAQEAQWQINYKGLQTFKNLYGHVNFPSEFIVPNEDPAWPSKLWNVQLGKIVRRLRRNVSTVSNERRQALDALGFNWKPNDTQWERNLLALKTFRAIHGHLRIRPDFVVPEDDPLWPRDLWNKKLGWAANYIRYASQETGYPASRLDQLTEIGFFEPRT